MGWFTRSEPAAEPPLPRELPPEPTDSSRRRRPPPEKLTKLSLERFLRDHPRVSVDVWASWCVPCRTFAPIFAEASGQWGDMVGFGKNQADHEPTLVTRFGIRSIPSLLFFREGKLVRTETGLIPPDRLDHLLHKVFRDLP